MKIQKVKSFYETEKHKIGFFTKVKYNFKKNYSFYHKFSTLKINILSFINQYKMTILLGLSFLFIFIFVFNNVFNLDPISPSEERRGQYVLINTTALLVFNVMVAMVWRFQKVVVPRGGLT